MPNSRIIIGNAVDSLSTLDDESVNCCLTSPPYWGLRSYTNNQQEIGKEGHYNDYIAKLVAVFQQVWRVLRKDGTLWVVIGDSYGGHGIKAKADKTAVIGSRRSDMTITDKTLAGIRPKELAGIPWRLAFALQEAGWLLRCDIIWAKKNPTPTKVKDRPTSAHEYVFLFSKSPSYYYDYLSIAEPNIAEPGKLKNKRDVWWLATQRNYFEAHYAVLPTELAELCIKAGCPRGGTVLDPFVGSGTVLEISQKLGRNSIGIDLNPEYEMLMRKRLARVK